MDPRQKVLTPESFKTFGDLLRYLRTRAGLSQRELAARVNYHYAHLNRIENNQRLPDESVLLARFVPVLSVEDKPEWVQRLLQLREEAESIQQAPSQKEKVSTVAERHYVPRIQVSLLGRQQEIGQVSTLLLHPETRLITLVGPPGVGKTSLALYTAGKLEHQFTHGALFVDLSPVNDANMVLNTLASALRIQEPDSGSELKLLQSHLKEHQLLIVLDNFEQVIDASVQVSSLMRSTPMVKYLVTSREALRIQGEREYPIQPLPAPAHDDRYSSEDLDLFPAMKLFVQRAESIHPSFQLTPENGSLVAEICRRLDGLPLAIEFAASCIKTMSLNEMVAQLDQRLEWLTRGRRDSADWRKTLRGALDWSYTLLIGQERALLNRLSVFSGGWTLEFAQAVCSDELFCIQEDIKGLLVNLVDKSLVISDADNDGTRYRFLDTVRYYALEKLEEAGEYEEYRRRHIEWFVRWSESLCYDFDRLPMPAFNRQVGQEYNNLRSALDWGLQHQPADEINLRLAIGVCRLWFETNHFIEGTEWAERFLPHAHAHKLMRARLSYLAAALAHFAYWTYRKGSVADLFEESISLARGLGDNPTLAAALHLYSFVFFDAKQYLPASQYLQESSEILRTLNVPLALSLALTDLGSALHRQGHIVRARVMFDEALTIAGQIKDARCEAYALRISAVCLRFEKEYTQALFANQRALEKTSSLGDRFNSGQVLAQMSVLSNLLEEYTDSSRYASESFSYFHSIGNEYQLPFPIRLQGYASLRLGNMELARAHCHESIKKNYALGGTHEIGVFAGLILLAEIELIDGDVEFARRLFHNVLAKKEELNFTFQEPDENAMNRLYSQLMFDGVSTTEYAPLNLEELINNF